MDLLNRLSGVGTITLGGGRGCEVLAVFSSRSLAKQSIEQNFYIEHAKSHPPGPI